MTARPEPGGRIGELAADLGLALSFLTIVPVRVAYRGPQQLARACMWFPVIGALVGSIAAASLVAAQHLFGRPVATVVALVVLVVVTGGLHQDGLADTADGLGVRGDRERRLEVMRDSAVGVFGVLALLAWGLLLVTALEPLSDRQAFVTLIAAAAAARWAAVLHAIATPAARLDGLGAGFNPTRSSIVLASVLAMVIVLVACGLTAGGLVVVAALVAALASVGFARKVVGGRTGDTLGATVAVTELCVCLTLLAYWKP
ncbi:MAG: adenosylcobinamide-GDP ribazoletransferase [Gaiellales bacterium]|nr:adenosylcobinamide-GDP ribazoletransferase [Gaiellales bacterium]